MTRPPILVVLEQQNLSLVQSREARARVDAARVLHDRLTRELAQLERSTRQNPVAIEAFRRELEQARSALRAANRELIRSI